ncbi:diphosphomevalonate decarboxylase [Sulfuracidifex tepidarius]|uniref:Diphosphomevalonate decarboxylase n=1 Tax=Sulfuracidifex tepidarius TaxID=1294262 RepID=A0A510E652_9CREN|nr:diphosphomevalonate decarboxylase [Sulfuracidifex tepidarius]BBG25221.1 Diphosphomevalonate decarboxylase [Sulfuracidifex tepidarius]BBG28015.1 Diphosphomevalonate decarboxylase [Sulfuracidifex tepidarius]
MLEGEAEAPSNIAIVKYWGKRNSALNLPLNDSLSISLEALKVRSKVVFDPELSKDKVRVNGVKLSDEEVKSYASRVLDRMREISGKSIYAVVDSWSNFPSSAGLASSAAGIAALTLASSDALGLKMDPKELSKIARLGSGSACRSVYGGFVIWHSGARDDGEDSFCEQIFTHDHWRDLVDLIPIFTDEKKRISSRKGMSVSVETSNLMKCRLEFVRETLPSVLDSIRNRDAKKFFEMTIRHSNSMHAIMMDSFPPLIYLNAMSLKVIDSFGDGKIAGYTFDAGPNPHVFTLRKDAESVEKTLIELGATKVIKSDISAGPRVGKKGVDENN